MSANTATKNRVNSRDPTRLRVQRDSPMMPSSTSTRGRAQDGGGGGVVAGAAGAGPHAAAGAPGSRPGGRGIGATGRGREVRVAETLVRGPPADGGRCGPVREIVDGAPWPGSTSSGVRSHGGAPAGSSAARVRAPPGRTPSETPPAVRVPVSDSPGSPRRGRGTEALPSVMSGCYVARRPGVGRVTPSGDPLPPCGGHARRAEQYLGPTRRAAGSGPTTTGRRRRRVGRSNPA